MASSQKDAPNAALFEPNADAAVERDISAPEFVDRLLRIAYQEQLSRSWRNAQPVGLFRIRRRKQQQNLRLQRIGVLKFVDKYVREPLLEIRSHFRVLAQ